MKKKTDLVKNNIYIFVLIGSQIVFISVMRLFVDFGMTENVKFFSDVILFFLICCAFINKSERRKCLVYYILLVSLWSTFLFARSIFGFVNIQHIVFSLRNWYRGMLFFYIVYCYLDGSGIIRIFRLIKILGGGDAAVMLLKFLLFSSKGDSLSGIFWDNGTTNVMLCILTILVVVEYIQNKIKYWQVAVFFSITMVTAALEELKAFYFEFWMIIILTIILELTLSKSSDIFKKKRILKVICSGIVFFLVGLFILNLVFPLSLRYMTSTEGYSMYENLSLVSYKIRRVQAFSDINNMFFFDNINYNLFGLGFGTTFAVNTHLFYACHQKLYFEGGIVSYLLFNAIIVGIGVKNFVVILKGKYDTIYNKISLVMAIICVILTIYDSSMYKEISYIIYFVLACGDISTKEALEKERLDEQGAAAVFESVK